MVGVAVMKPDLRKNEATDFESGRQSAGRARGRRSSLLVLLILTLNCGPFATETIQIIHNFNLSTIYEEQTKRSATQIA